MSKKSMHSLVAVGLFAAPAVSMAQLSANIGYVTDYVFRGIHQEESSPFAGLDYEDESGFYIGTWGADVGAGLETDLYFGYSGGEDLTYTIGFTGYYYTDDWDDTYTEINLGIGYGIFSLDHAIGEWDGFGSPVDYTFTSVTIAPEGGYYFTYGDFGDQTDGSFLEIGYGFDFMGLDLSLALIISDETGVFQAEDTVLDPFGNPLPISRQPENQLVFGISKAIDIGN